MIGIGNPGTEYARTRHNAGSMALDCLAEKQGVSFRRGRLRALEAGFRHGGHEVLLLKPLTFVNLSGETVRLALQSHDLDAASDLLVAADDADLPLGALRFKHRGSSGQHKGLEDVIRVVGEDFQRLRIGIGRGAGVPLRDYVLSPVPPEERPVFAAAIERAAQAVLDWLDFGIQYCQNHYNRKVPGTTERSQPADGKEQGSELRV